MTNEEKLELINQKMIDFWEEHAECHDSEVEEIALVCIAEIGEIVAGKENAKQ